MCIRRCHKGWRTDDGPHGRHTCRYHSHRDWTLTVRRVGYLDWAAWWIRKSAEDGAAVLLDVESVYYDVGEGLLALREWNAEGHRLCSAYDALGARSIRLGAPPGEHPHGD